MPDINQPRFSLRDIYYYPLCDGYRIVTITDVACHLWFRWSATEPDIHVVPVLKRGTYLHGEPYLCFVSYHDNEQEEAGDTFLHTFVKTGWEYCETRYFSFWATVAGAPAASTTANFKLHFHGLEAVAPANGDNRSISQRNALWPPCHDAASGFRLYLGPAPDYLLKVEAAETIRFWIYRCFLRFPTSVVPAGGLVAGATLQIYVKSWLRTSSAAEPHIQITKGVQWSPVTLANYGDQLPMTTVLGQRELTTFVLEEYNAIELNQDGVDWIDPTGDTLLCLRQEMDVLNAEPALGTNQIYFHGAQAGATKRPFLTVCYSIPPYESEPIGA